jgi:hypothetical protein
MVAVPMLMPLTIPVVGPTVAIAGALLVYIPPVVALPNVLEDPIHILKAPVIADGSGFTVATAVT